MSAVEPSSAAYLDGNSRKVKKISFPWTSDASGDASVTLTKPISGFIVGFETIPGTGDDQPSDNYDVDLNTEDGTDLLSGKGDNRDDTNAEYFCPAASMDDGVTAGVAPPAYDGLLTLVVANAGNAKSGTANVFIY